MNGWSKMWNGMCCFFEGVNGERERLAHVEWGLGCSGFPSVVPSVGRYLGSVINSESARRHMSWVPCRNDTARPVGHPVYARTDPQLCENTRISRYAPPLRRVSSAYSNTRCVVGSSALAVVFAPRSLTTSLASGWLRFPTVGVPSAGGCLLRIAL